MVQMNKKVGLIVIDNPLREFDGIKELKKQFSTENYWIIICSKLDFIDYLKFMTYLFIYTFVIVHFYFWIKIVVWL